MAFIITENCLGVCDTECVQVCPVDCIHGPLTLDEIDDIKEKFDYGEEPPQLKAFALFIDPVTCIDCGACPSECPVDAIYEEDELRELLDDGAVPKHYEEWIKLNELFFEDEDKGPNLVQGLLSHYLDNNKDPEVLKESLKNL